MCMETIIGNDILQEIFNGKIIKNKYIIMHFVFFSTVKLIILLTTIFDSVK